MNKNLHIVTHDVPYPADFGGVVDIFYKIKYLHGAGIKIQLHCFEKNRKQQVELEKYCDTVTYYKRKGLFSFSFTLPFIVSSRKSTSLLKNLQKDNYPILFEGIHSTFHLFANKLNGRKTFVRLFNVEHIYYGHLAKYEGHFIKRFYYKWESKLLYKYEQAIANKSHILTLSHQDAETYIDKFCAKQVDFLPAFLPYQNVQIHADKGTYCLYHGNLEVNENEEAAIWLILNVFSTLVYPLIIAGRNPSKQLQKLAEKNKNVSIVASPSETNMQLLIENAQINVLPSFNNTGVKLKLLNALYNGRHCLVNIAGTMGSGLEGLCHIAEDGKDFVNKIEQIFNDPFTQKEIQHRSTALKKLYDNEKNAQFIYDALP